MQEHIINFKRHFQIWKYTVGHRQLLIRSTKSKDFSTRIDVLFKGVLEFHLPTSFDDLCITKATADEVQKLCSLHQTHSFQNNIKVFTVQGVGFIGYVAALVVASHEDDGNYDEPSYFDSKNR